MTMHPATEAAWQARRSVARLRQEALDNPVLFTAMVLRDEATGRPIFPAPMHEEWHALASKHARLLIWAHVEAGKSQQLAVGRVLHALAVDPNTRCAIVSNTHKQAEKVVRTIARYIQGSEVLRQIAPALTPGAPWTSTQLTVERTSTAKDPSVQAFGVHGNVLGARLDLLILDDVLDPENCATARGREDLHAWYLAALAGRLTDKARVICVGTAYHKDDLLHRLASSPGWKAVRYPAIDPATGVPRWPEHWSPERIARKREELGPLEFARQMLCQARDDADARFKREWIDVALRAGDGIPLMSQVRDLPPGHLTVTGVDLAVQQHSAADLTVLFTILVMPDGKRRVLEVDAGRWSGPDIITRLIDANRRYGSTLVVENNAAQDFIIQFARERAATLPLRAHTTGRNKAHPEWGVESIAAELAAGKWIIPNQGGRCHPQVQAWIDDMLYYNPQSHTGDRLMASWFAREGARATTVRAETGRVDWLVR